MKKIITIFVIVFLSISTFAQNVELSNKLIEKYKTGQANSVRKDATLHDRLWLSPILREAIINWNELTDDAKAVFAKYKARPTFSGTEKTAESGNYRFHYTTNGSSGENVSSTDANANSIPDYVDNMMAKFATVYNLYHTTSGMTVPPGDGIIGSNAKYDIYISGDEAGDGVYGYVAPEFELGNNPNSASLTEDDAYTSYMVMRNNYSGFGDQNVALSVTAAHEYMHATQFGYDGNMDAWFMEACATWAEDYAFAGYDDNFQYLSSVFGTPDVALNFEDGNTASQYDGHWYGAWIFVRFMTEHTNNSIVKSIYERCISQNSLNAINTELTTNWNSDLNKIFAQFNVANVLMTNNEAFAPYTYSRATNYASYLGTNGTKYENSSSPFNFTGTTINWNSQTNGNSRLMRLSADYFKMTTTKNFKITFTATTTEAILVLIKATSNSIEYTYCNANQSINVVDYANWSKFIPLVIRYDKSITSTTALSYSLKIENTNTSVEELSSKVAIYPNPAVDYIVISTENDFKGKAIITDLTGKQFATQNLCNKTNTIDVTNIINGIYFLHLEKDNVIIKTEKIIIAH